MPTEYKVESREEELERANRELHKNITRKDEEIEKLYKKLSELEGRNEKLEKAIINTFIKLGSS